MPSATSPQHDKPQPTRLKLVMNSKNQFPEHSQEPVVDGHQPQTNKEPSGSPPRPSYSPVTPTLPHNSLAINTSDVPPLPLPGWIDEPEGAPVSLEENPDAIAVRAAISILQMQRQQSLRDIRGLEVMKHSAMTDTESFVEDLKAGRLSQHVDNDVEVKSESEDDEPEPMPRSRFGKLPSPQNIVRCPPVAWEKYHVVGEPLDRVHEVQRRRPGTRTDVYGNTALAPEHVIAAPYRPLVDKIADTPVSRPHAPG